MFSPVTCNIIKLYVLIHAKSHDKADSTVHLLVTLRIWINIAPLEISDCDITRIIDANNRLFWLRRPYQYLRVILGTTCEKVALMIPFYIFNQIFMTLPNFERRMWCFNTPKIYLRLTGSSELSIILPSYIEDCTWLTEHVLWLFLYIEGVPYHNIGFITSRSNQCIRLVPARTN